MFFTLLAAALDQSRPTYHYIRSNIDGSLPENIVMRVQARDEVTVFKFVRSGTRSALVFCRMEPDLRSPRTLRSYMLEGPSKRLMATLDYDRIGGFAKVFVAPSKAPAESVLIAQPDWHIYNMDLASLVLTLARYRSQGFTFEFVEPNTNAFTPAMISLGTFTLTPGRSVDHLGVRCRPWTLKGGALGSRVGKIWMSELGYLVDAQIPLPNHEGYRDFKMVLKRRTLTTTAEWQQHVRTTLQPSRSRE